MMVKAYSMHSRVGRGEPFELRYLYPWIFGEYTRIGFAVIGAWLILVLVRGWRPERSWLDRAGRVGLVLDRSHALLPGLTLD